MLQVGEPRTEASYFGPRTDQPSVPLPTTLPPRNERCELTEDTIDVRYELFHANDSEMHASATHSTPLCN